MAQTRLIQITDGHLLVDRAGKYREQRVYENLQCILLDLAQYKPDALLLTGDLAQQISRETYQHYVDLLQDLQIPIYWIPGNHDDMALMSEVFSGHFSAERSVNFGAWQMILLNSCLPYDSGEGEINAAMFSFLEAELKRHHDRSILVVLHHHVLPVQGLMDKYSLQNAQAFEEVLLSHKNIKVVLSGHIHQAFDCEKAGIRFLTTPSTSYQIKPHTPTLVFDELSCGYRILDLGPGAEFSTTICRLLPKLLE